MSDNTPTLAEFETLLEDLSSAPWSLTEHAPESGAYGGDAPLYVIESAVKWRGFTNNLNVDEDKALGQFIVTVRNGLPGLIEQTRALATGLLDIAEAASMPDSYWLTDTRVARACKALGITPEQARDGERGEGTAV